MPTSVRDNPVQPTKLPQRWAKAPGRKGRRYREFLTMWRGYPLAEASWVPKKDFSDQRQLQIDLEKDNPPEEK